MNSSASGPLGSAFGVMLFLTFLEQSVHVFLEHTKPTVTTVSCLKLSAAKFFQVMDLVHTGREGVVETTSQRGLQRQAWKPHVRGSL